ncbi:MAG TPA: RlmE family RNA methyltransferase [Methanomicrobiales archaeon]|jgi:23S rRNA (uridine2552-2'-O)-methyltransferase|nr:RlmE family RNA methyltransferase [Methanomicrobiales archaeon]
MRQGASLKSGWASDTVHRRAAREGYRSRAAYKLLEIEGRFHVIRQGDSVIDLGAAPGSWLQVISELTKGTILGVDLQQVPPLPGVVTITGDFTDPAVQGRILAEVPEASVVVSDAAPHLSGNRSLDQARAVGIGEDALAFACRALKPGGNFVVKSFQGEDFDGLLASVRTSFRSVHVYRPRVTRKGSRECYIIGRNFAGRESC